MAEHVVRDMLEKAALRTSCHMPGHGGHAPCDISDFFALDTTEISVTDDFYGASGALKEAQEKYSRAAGAGCSLFLHNGSTQGIHAMLEMYAGEGDTVILPRNCHLSAVQACILGGLKPVWIPVRTFEGYPYVSVRDVLDTMQAHPEARSVLLTRPDYFGGCMPMEETARMAGQLGMKVLVDEAHGAHLPWHGRLRSAGSLGADAWVQSAHKTLPALTGTAVLHLRDADDGWRAMRILRREQTSSPSFLFMLSLDEARAYMEEKGEEAEKRRKRLAGQIRRAACRMGYTDPTEQWKACGYDFDEDRVVLKAPEGGKMLLKKLEEMGVDPEMAMGSFAVLLVPLLQSDEENRIVCEAFEKTGAQEETCGEPEMLPVRLPEQVLLPRAAACGPVERVPLDRAAGRIAADCAGCYPPGIPLVVPGEYITEETVRRLNQAGASGRFGIYEGMMLCAAV